MKLHPAARVIAWSTIGVLGLAGAAGAAETVAAPHTGSSSALVAASPTPGSPTTGSPTPGAPAPGKNARHRHGGELAGRALHGEFVVPDKTGKPVTFDVQRGTFALNKDGSVTVTSSDHFAASYQIDPTTKVRTGKGTTGKLSDIAPGTEVRVVAVNVNGKKTARVVSTRVPKPHKTRHPAGTSTPTAPSNDLGGSPALGQGTAPLGA